MELGYDGCMSRGSHMLPILINHKIHHTLTYCEIILSIIIPKHITCSPTCLSVETGDKYRY